MDDNNEKDKTGSFKQKDLTDGRNFLDWQSKYPQKAIYWIIAEFIYLMSFVLFTPLLCVACYLKVFPNFLSIEINLLNTLEPYIYAWLGGAFGGALYGLKWTYHCVAKGLWHSDRRPWRLLIPIIAGSFALVFSILILSNFFKVFDEGLLRRPGTFFVIGFFVGYFSDSAAAKLVEISNSIFGLASKK